MELVKAFFIAASGIRAQSERIRIISENIANASSTANTPGGDPYRRKTISFRSHFDAQLGANTVQLLPVTKDLSPFSLQYDPNHPAANADGYVALPNVNTIIEMMDLREAQRTYEANLAVMEMSKDMAGRTIELLRG